MPEQTEIDVNDLGMSELESYDAEPAAPEAEAEPSEHPEPDQPQAEPEAEPEPEPQGAGDEEEPKDVRGARKAYYESREELKAIKAQLRERELELLRIKAESVQTLTAAELEDLKVEDPDAYIAYREKEIEAKKYQADIEKRQRDYQDEDAQELQRKLFLDVVDFASQVTGVKVSDPKPGMLPKEITEFASSEEYQKVSRYLDDRFFKRGIQPDAEDMMAAYRHINFDSLAAKQAAREAQKVKANIEHAARSGSALDRAPADSRKSTRTSFDDWTPKQHEDFLANAGQNELSEYSKWLDERTAR